MAEPCALPALEIHTKGPTSVLDSSQSEHTHVYAFSALSHSLSRIRSSCS